MHTGANSTGLRAFNDHGSCHRMAGLQACRQGHILWSNSRPIGFEPVEIPGAGPGWRISGYFFLGPPSWLPLGCRPYTRSSGDKRLDARLVVVQQSHAIVPLATGDQGIATAITKRLSRFYSPANGN